MHLHCVFQEFWHVLCTKPPLHMFQRQLFSNPKNELRPGIFFGKEMVRKLDAPHDTGSNGAEIQGVVKQHHRPSSGNAFGGIRMRYLINRINCTLCRVVEANDIWLLLWGLRSYCAIMMRCAHDYNVFVSFRLVVDNGGFVLNEEGRMQLQPSFVFEGLRRKRLLQRTVPTNVRPLFWRTSDSSLSVKKLSVVTFLPLLKKGADRRRATFLPQLTCLSAPSGRPR